jgi:chromosome segregation ATPase
MGNFRHSRVEVRFDGPMSDEGKELELEEVLESAAPEEGSIPPPLPPGAAAQRAGSLDPRDIIKNQEALIAGLRRELTTRSQALTKAHDKYKALEAETYEVRERLVSLEMQLTTREREVQGHAAELEQMRDSAQRLEEVLAAHDARCEELATLRAEMEALKNAVDERGDQSARIAELEAKAMRAEARAEEAERTLAQVERESIRDQLARDASLADMQAEVKKQMEEQEKAHQREFAEVKNSAVAEALRVLKSNRRNH